MNILTDVEEKFKDETGWIRKFTPNVVVDNGYVSYRLADANYVAWING